MTVLTFTGVLQIFSCGHCSMQFAMPSGFEQQRRRDHQSFFCPAGHPMAWKEKSDLELLTAQRENALQRAQQLRNLLDDERDQHHRTERRLRSTRGVVTRTKARIAAGSCPRCHARFPDLKHHMDEKHPDYAETAHNKGVASAK